MSEGVSTSIEPKQVLISIKPRWIRLMLSKEKRLEIRKSYPKLLETPFKAIVYCTKDVKDELVIPQVSDKPVNGKIIGEFTCESVIGFTVPFLDSFETMDEVILKESCVTWEQLHWYAGRRKIYGWEISSFVLYKEPKNLEEFGMHSGPLCWNYIYIKGE